MFLSFLRLCLLSVLVLSPLVATAASDSEATLQRFYNKVDTLKAHFHQVQHDSNGNVMQTVDGTFYLARPKRFRWVYEKPYHQVIVSNGSVFKFYDVGLKQVTVRSIGDSLKATPAQLLAGGTALKQAFAIDKMAAPDDKNNADPQADWIQMTPRSDNSQFKQIRMQFENDAPRIMRLSDKLGQTTRIKFTDIQINPDLADKRFQLDTPDDVDVVDARESNQRAGASD